VLYFTGEMIYPWMIDADPVLRPLRAAADILAERDDWPPLYDPARLGVNEVGDHPRQIGARKYLEPINKRGFGYTHEF